MRNFSSYFLGFIGGFAFATLLVLTTSYLNEDVMKKQEKTPPKESITPTYQGSYGEIQRDTVEYNQHPGHKMYRMHWENH